MSSCLRWLTLCYCSSSYTPSNYKKQASWASQGKSWEEANVIFAATATFKQFSICQSLKLKGQWLWVNACPLAWSTLHWCFWNSHRHFLYSQVREKRDIWNRSWSERQNTWMTYSRLWKSWVALCKSSFTHQESYFLFIKYAKVLWKQPWQE